LISETYVLSSLSFKVEVLHSHGLKKAQRDHIWSIYEDNMYDLSKNSSFGWDPAKKRKEIFHSLSRFILVYDEEDMLVAFVMFRFEHEYDEDILYCYEIQVAASARGKGLGKGLLGDLEKICKEYNMEKVTLTVLKSNSKARSFYGSLGFVADPEKVWKGSTTKFSPKSSFTIAMRVDP